MGGDFKQDEVLYHAERASCDIQQLLYKRRERGCPSFGDARFIPRSVCHKASPCSLYGSQLKKALNHPSPKRRRSERNRLGAVVPDK
jgi:hypothetical protein